MKNITNTNTKPMINAEDICDLIHNDAVPTEALNEMAELVEKYDELNSLLIIAQKYSPYIAFQICKCFPDLHDDLVWAIDSLPMDKFSAEEPSILNCEVIR